MKKYIIFLLIAFFSISTLFIGISCKAEAPPAEEVAEEEAPAEEITAEVPTTKEIEAVEAEAASESPWAIEFTAGDVLQLSEISTTGPHGEIAANIGELTLDATDILKFKREGLNIRVIAIWHFDEIWTEQQSAGFKVIADLLGWEFQVLEGADFSVERQTAMLENALIMEPDILFTHPVSETEQVAMYETIADTGILHIVSHSLPEGLVYNEHYASVIGRDNVGIGVLVAHSLAEKMGGKGKIGTVTLAFYHESVTKIYNGFKDTIENEYPDIEIVYENVWSEFGEVGPIVEAMLLQNPDISGIAPDWSVPAMEAVAAARAMGRTPEDLHIVTYDLEPDVATELASGGLIKSIISDDPFQAGVIAGIAAARALLGKPVPPYLSVPVALIEREQIPEAWKYRYHEDAPQEILDLLGR